MPDGPAYTYLARIFPLAVPVGEAWDDLTSRMIQAGHGTAYFGGPR